MTDQEMIARIDQSIDAEIARFGASLREGSRRWLWERYGVVSGGSTLRVLANPSPNQPPSDAPEGF